MRLFPKSYNTGYYTIVYITNLCQSIVYIHATINSHLQAQFASI